MRLLQLANWNIHNSYTRKERAPWRKVKESLFVLFKRKLIWDFGTTSVIRQTQQHPMQLLLACAEPALYIGWKMINELACIISKIIDATHYTARWNRWKYVSGKSDGYMITTFSYGTHILMFSLGSLYQKNSDSGISFSSNGCCVVANRHVLAKFYSQTILVGG